MDREAGERPRSAQRVRRQSCGLLLHWPLISRGIFKSIVQKAISVPRFPAIVGDGPLSLPFYGDSPAFGDCAPWEFPQHIPGLMHEKSARVQFVKARRRIGGVTECWDSLASLARADNVRLRGSRRGFEAVRDFRRGLCAFASWIGSTTPCVPPKSISSPK
jgi:hypothetical protein